MQRTIFSLLVITAVVSFAFASCTKKMDQKSVKQVSEERQVGDFDRVILEGPGQLVLRPGKNSDLQLTAPEEFIGHIRTQVHDDKLIIKTEMTEVGQLSEGDIKIDLTFKKLEKIHLKGSAQVRTAQPIEVEDLELLISGNGKAILGIIGDKLTVNISGIGKVTTEGKVDEQSITISGVGTYDGLALKSEEAKVQVSGAGSAVVNVSDRLDVDISGTGKVSYTGQPKITQKISGRGAVAPVEQK